MVEVWLPYRDTEIPIMLPDPINLKIMPKTVYPARVEREALEKIDLIFKKVKEPKIYIPIYADEVERSFIKGVLRRRRVEYVEVDDPESSDAIIDIFRYDPILGYRSSIWASELHDDPVNKLRKYIAKRDKKPSGIHRDKLYIDLILDGGARIYDVFVSRDGSHFEDARRTYDGGWCLKTEFSPLVIASMGGIPWDSSLTLYLTSLTKLYLLGRPEVGIISISGVTLKDLDPSIFKELDIDSAEDVSQLYMAYSLSMLRNLNIVHYGSIPKSILSIFGFSKTSNPERYLSRIPMAKKRDILVIEDLYLLNPSICIREEVEGGA